MSVLELEILKSLKGVLLTEYKDTAINDIVSLFFGVTEKSW